MLKDPDAVLPYTVDWTAWLTGEGDTAASVAWTVPSGIVKQTAAPHTETLVGGVATAWFSGGTAGQTYLITCRITTTGGRIDDRTLKIQVRDR